MSDEDKSMAKHFEYLLDRRGITNPRQVAEMWLAFKAGADFALSQIRDVVPTESKKQAG